MRAREHVRWQKLRYDGRFRCFCIEKLDSWPSLCTNRSTCGIALAEVIMAIGIISLLIALLLPAVNSARESARKVDCSNRLRQVSIACESNKDLHGRYPSGTMSKRTEYPFASWMNEILPQLQLVDAFAQSRADYALTPEYSSHQYFGMAIPIFQCPSDGRVSVAQFSIRHQFKVGLTSFLGVNGTNYASRDGIFFLDSRIRDRDVRDGKSNTMLIGERPPSPLFDYGWWYAAHGVDSTGCLDHTLGVRELATSRYANCERPSTPSIYNECSANGYWSLHTTGFHAAFSDASVRYLMNIDPNVLCALAGRDDGYVISADESIPW